jgi:putative addiction module antidote
MQLKVRKQGNSLGVIIPKEMLAVMNVTEGDTLFVTKTPTGYEISPCDPDFEMKIAAARKGMSKYRNALKELAK